MLRMVVQALVVGVEGRMQLPRWRWLLHLFSFAVLLFSSLSSWFGCKKAMIFDITENKNGARARKLF